jgi:hypothetical protein
MTRDAPPRERRWWTQGVCALLLSAGLLSVCSLQRGIDQARGGFRSISDVLFMPSGMVIRKLCLGHEGLVAGIYWTRVVQYFGR